MTINLPECTLTSLWFVVSPGQVQVSNAWLWLTIAGQAGHGRPWPAKAGQGQPWSILVHEHEPGPTQYTIGGPMPLMANPEANHRQPWPDMSVIISQGISSISASSALAMLSKRSVGVTLVASLARLGRFDCAARLKPSFCAVQIAN